MDNGLTTEKAGLDLSNVADLTPNTIGRQVRMRVGVQSNSGNGYFRLFVLQQQQHTVQALLAMSEAIPKDTIRSVANIGDGSLVDVLGVVSGVDTKVANCSQQDVELRLQKVELVSQKDKTAEPEDSRSTPAAVVHRPSRRVLLESVPLSASTEPTTFPTSLELRDAKAARVHKFDSVEEYMQHLIEKPNKQWDLTMKGVKADGFEADYGFLSISFAQDKPAPKDMVHDETTDTLEELCTTDVREALEKLMSLKIDHHSKNNFFKEKAVVEQLVKIRMLFDQHGLKKGCSKRCRILDCLQSLIGYTRQTLNTHIVSAVTSSSSDDVFE